MSTAIVEPGEAHAETNDRWSVAQGQQNGKPLLIRFRNERPYGVQAADFPFLLSVTWSYQPNEFGLPSSEEMALMDTFEDALSSSLEGSGSAHLMVVLTNNGERDWLWYTGSEEQAMSQVNKALQGHKRYPVQFSVQKDRSWQAYTQFVNDDASQASGGGSLIGWAVSKAAQLFRR